MNRSTWRDGPRGSWCILSFLSPQGTPLLSPFLKSLKRHCWIRKNLNLFSSIDYTCLVDDTQSMFQTTKTHHMLIEILLFISIIEINRGKTVTSLVSIFSISLMFKPVLCFTILVWDFLFIPLKTVYGHYWILKEGYTNDCWTQWQVVNFCTETHKFYEGNFVSFTTHILSIRCVSLLSWVQKHIFVNVNYSHT